MRHALVALLLVVLPLAAIPVAGAAQQETPPRVAIAGVDMAGPHSLRVEVATDGLTHRGPQSPRVTITAWLDGVPTRAALPLIGMPPRFAMIFDLPAGVIRVGGVTIGTFQPVPRFTENLRFPVEVTVRLGTRVATARAVATILLPTVIVPGYLNALGGPDENVLAAFRRHGYTTEGSSQTLFWFRYLAQRVTLPAGARALAAYVRRVVLPSTYASRINVVGYSAGGLLARWNVAYNTDAWATLVDRLVLVGVPNEGAVMAYVDGHAPGFLFAGLAQTPLARTLSPTFPFWRPDLRHPWTTPPDGHNGLLAQLNAQPLARTVRVYVLYGSDNPSTMAGVTGPLPGTALSYGVGDGIVLAASAQGLPIHGGPGVASLTDGAVVRVDLGSVYHLHLLRAAADRTAARLLDRFQSTVDEGSTLNWHPWTQARRAFGAP